MGTLAAVLAGKKIVTSQDRYHAEVKGEIENVNDVLKITRIHVDYFLQVNHEQEKDAKDSLNTYLPFCPGAQSVIGCIEISHEITYT